MPSVGIHAKLALLLIVVSTAALLSVGCEKRPAPAARSVTVFAAASTTDAMQQIGRLFHDSRGVEVRFSFDASSNLAKQIKAGAPADLFISADQRWMDDVAAAAGGGVVKTDTRQDLLANQLALISRKDHPLNVRAARDFSLATDAPTLKRLAMGDPAHVPAGRYGRQSLEWLGWWNDAQPLVIAAPDVRAAVRLVELGEADAGIVYSTDALASDKVVVIATFPDDSHEPIRYPVALTTRASPEAADFLAYLRSPDATAVFEHAGFKVIAPPGGR